MDVSTKNIKRLYLEALSAGESGRDTALKLYKWAQRNRKRLTKVVSLEWMNEAFFRVYNMMPLVYLEFHAKLGGGSDTESLRRGNKKIRAVGLPLAMEMTRVLGVEKARTINSVSAARKAIEEVSEAARKLRKVRPKETKDPADWRSECHRLRRENESLKQEVATLKAKLEKVKRKILDDLDGVDA